MGKPTPDKQQDETTFIDSTGAEHPLSVLDRAVVRPIATAGEKTIIRAEPGKPWPEPPSCGTWSRDPKSGDLALEEPGTQRMTEEERRARRAEQRASAIKASTTTAKE